MSRAPESRPPVVQTKLGLTDKVLEIAAGCGVFLIILILVRYWQVLPDLIPHNFDSLGNVDRWGRKNILLVISALIVGVYGALTILPMFSDKFRYFWPVTVRNAEMSYRMGATFLRWVKTEIVWMYMFIQWKTIQVALGQATGLGILFLPTSLAIVNVTIVLALCRVYGSK